MENEKGEHVNVIIRRRGGQDIGHAEHQERHLAPY